MDPASSPDPNSMQKIVTLTRRTTSRARPRMAASPSPFVSQRSSSASLPRNGEARRAGRSAASPGGEPYSEVVGSMTEEIREI